MGDGTAVGSMLVDGASDGSEVGLLDGSLDGCCLRGQPMLETFIWRTPQENNS